MVLRVRVGARWERGTENWTVETPTAVSSISIDVRVLLCGCVSVFPDASLAYTSHTSRKSTFPSWLERPCRDCNEEIGDIWIVMAFPLGGGERTRGWITEESVTRRLQPVEIPELSSHRRLIPLVKNTVGMLPARPGLQSSFFSAPYATCRLCGLG